VKFFQGGVVPWPVDYPDVLVPELFICGYITGHVIFIPVPHKT
jgi:hypothetical protein